MKKNLIALAVLAASGAAFAQSNVTVYGLVDVAFTNVNTNGLTQTGIDSGGVNTSRFGFKGSEDLGGGLKANFLLEQGFNVDNGAASTAGQMFARQSYVGFSGGFGEVKLGKIFTAYDDISGAANAAFDSNLLAPVNGVWASVGYNDRPFNGVYYASPVFSGVSGAASYSFSENKTAAAAAGSVSSFHVKYEGGPIYAGLAYQNEQADGNTASTQFTRLNGTYDLGVAKVLVGFGKVEQAADANTKEWELGADFPVSKALTVSGGVARSISNFAAGDVSREGYSIAALYTLSKRTSVYGGYKSNTAKQAGVADIDNSAFAVGVKHAF